jgi:two-component system cell cycle sensor histidine kinase PleC
VIPKAIDMAMPIRPAPPTALCASIFERLMAEPDLLYIPVVMGNTPLGLVCRQKFMLTYASLYGKELYGRRPITVLMYADPMIMDGRLDCEEVNARIFTDKTTLNPLQGFIVTHGGRYAGVGTVSALMTHIATLMGERAHQLEMQTQRAEAASNSKTQFLASMSHELRTPLNAIIGFADLIRNETFGTIQPARYLEYVSDIQSSGTHLLGVINDILDMAKIEAGRFELHEETIDPVDLMGDVLRMMTPAMDAKNITASIRQKDIGEKEHWICADERQLRQVILNLISNAVKFTQADGSIMCAVDVLADGGLEFTVQDTGMGVPADMVEKIFEPFEQVENSFTRTSSGTGLGLPLSRAMIEAHGGTLYLDSIFGQGSTVHIRWPKERVMDGSGIALSA